MNKSGCADAQNLYKPAPSTPDARAIRCLSQQFETDSARAGQPEEDN